MKWNGVCGKMINIWMACIAQTIVSTDGNMTSNSFEGLAFLPYQPTQSNPESSLDACVYYMTLAGVRILSLRAVNSFNMLYVWAESSPQPRSARAKRLASCGVQFPYSHAACVITPKCLHHSNLSTTMIFITPRIVFYTIYFIHF